MKYIRRWSRIVPKIRSRYSRHYRILRVFHSNFKVAGFVGHVSSRLNFWGYRPVFLSVPGCVHLVDLRLIQGRGMLIQNVILKYVSVIFGKSWVDFIARSLFDLWFACGRFTFLSSRIDGPIALVIGRFRARSRLFNFLEISSRIDFLYGGKST